MAEYGEKKMAKKINYDKENDILSVHKGFASDEKFNGNIDVGELILDLSTKGRVRGIEIMNASRFFKEFDIDRKMLERMSDIQFDTSIKSSGIILAIVVKNKDAERLAKIAVPLVR